MAYNLIYHADVQKVDLPRIDEKNKSMIKRAIEERLATQPEVLWEATAENASKDIGS